MLFYHEDLKIDLKINFKSYLTKTSFQNQILKIPLNIASLNMLYQKLYWKLRLVPKHGSHSQGNIRSTSHK